MNVAAGNAMVFNAHPAARVSTSWALQMVNKAIVEAGGPMNLATCCEIPSLDTLDAIAKSPKVSLMIGTGGPNMVDYLMKSGKKCICAGPGNPPSIVDETANLKEAAATLLFSHSMENNTLCIGEKEAFVVDEIFDEFVKEMEAAGAKVLTAEEAEKVVAVMLKPDEKAATGYVANKKFVGKNTKVILEAAGVACEGDPRTAIFEAANDNPLVQTEQLMPVLPLVRCKDFDQALEWAVAAEHGNRHSASIWSENTERVTRFGKAVKTTAFVQCAPTMTAVAGSPTIATPTGEGPCGPWSFLRKRRFSQGGGRGYIA
jgi:propionaldehyde dehydrogenase